MGEPLYIKSIDSQKMELSDDSEWQPLPGLEFPLSWKIGDKITHHSKEGRFASVLRRIINETKNEETGAIPIKALDDLRKSLGKNASEEDYPNLDVEIKIKKAESDLIWLQDDSKWHMWSHLPRDPGAWEVGDRVIVTRHITKSKESKLYQMENVQTKKTLMALFLGYER